MPSYRFRAAFTLVEILVTSSLVGLVLALAVPFFLTNSRILFVSEQKLLINSDIRTLTNEMVENAREANFFILYRSFHPWAKLGPTGNTIHVSRDSTADGIIDVLDRRQSGAAGDFLVFVFYTDPYFDARFYDNVIGNEPEILSTRVERLVAYWLAPNRDNPGEQAIYRLDTHEYRGTGLTWTTPWAITFPLTLSASVTVESLLPPATLGWAQHKDFTKVVNDVRGLTLDGSLYQNFQNRSVLVRAKVLHGNQAKRVTNTYNFTITPRG